MILYRMTVMPMNLSNNIYLIFIMEYLDMIKNMSKDPAMSK